MPRPLRLPTPGPPIGLRRAGARPPRPTRALLALRLRAGLQLELSALGVQLSPELAIPLLEGEAQGLGRLAHGVIRRGVVHDCIAECQSDVLRKVIQAFVLFRGELLPNGAEIHGLLHDVEVVGDLERDGVDRIRKPEALVVFHEVGEDRLGPLQLLGAASLLRVRVGKLLQVGRELPWPPRTTSLELLLRLPAAAFSGVDPRGRTGLLGLLRCFGLLRFRFSCRSGSRQGLVLPASSVRSLHARRLRSVVFLLLQRHGGGPRTRCLPLVRLGRLRPG
mmetsp:Transcript_6363/g.24728  ORF Transcript_6363/g.24728 Transcript_6363/m.24728 type:complete len:278 (-) Transcript_6363:1154-1987(-)